MKNYFELIEKFKELFNEFYFPTSKLILPIESGIHCGIGWYDLIERLCTDIMEICKKGNVEIPTVVQVKEKFGGLRFYINTNCDEISYHKIYEKIHEAEKESYKICDICGTTENVGMTGGYLQVICKKCFDSAEPNSTLSKRSWKQNI